MSRTAAGCILLLCHAVVSYSFNYPQPPSGNNQGYQQQHFNQYPLQQLPQQPQQQYSQYQHQQYNQYPQQQYNQFPQQQYNQYPQQQFNQLPQQQYNQYPQQQFNQLPQQQYNHYQQQWDPNYIQQGSYYPQPHYPPYNQFYQPQPNYNQPPPVQELLTAEDKREIYERSQTLVSNLRVGVARYTTSNGKVYAEIQQLQDIIVKLLIEQRQGNEAAMQRYYQEAETKLSQLEHEVHDMLVRYGAPEWGIQQAMSGAKQETKQLHQALYKIVGKDLTNDDETDQAPPPMHSPSYILGV